VKTQKSIFSQNGLPEIIKTIFSIARNEKNNEYKKFQGAKISTKT